ncbi:hypothetical protein FOA52_007372 [Chlamydomonas sp. UWO 241]|nr:hypothetical protein FOA52_007372 [Chlamydomonas sp. UWO 241]
MDADDAPAAPRAGRRARAAAMSADDSEAGMASLAPTEQLHDSRPRERESPAYASLAPQDPHELGTRPGDDEADEPPAPPPAARRGGFESGAIAPPRPETGTAILDDGDGKVHTGVSRRKQAIQQQAVEEAAKVVNKYDTLTERGTGAVESIMELEDEGREDLSSVIAAAPKVRNNKVQNLANLDEDMQFRLPATEDREIDLSLLTAFLCSSEQVDEADEVWDPDMLVSAVASELHMEQEKAQGQAEGKEGAESAPVSVLG